MRKLAQADRMLGEGKDVADVCHELGVSGFGKRAANYRAAVVIASLLLWLDP